MKLPLQSFQTAVMATIAFFIVAVPLSPAAVAAAIAVPNYSFEAYPVSDVHDRAGATGWVGSDAFFTENSGDEFFPGSAGSGTPIGADGPQHATLADYQQDVNFFQSAASLSSFVAGSTYQLTIAIGNLLPANEHPGTLRIGFLVGDAFVPGGDTTFQAANLAPEGAFRDFNFDYTAQADDAGKNLKIYVSELGHGTGNTQIDVAFDNVRLDIVPEPAAALLVLFAGTSVFGFGRRRDCIPKAE
jgi:hypothetical protein